MRRPTPKSTSISATASSPIGRLRAIADLAIEEDAPLAKMTTYKVGGHAEILLVPATVDALQSVLVVLASIDAPFLVLGNGSNVLVADAGVSGCVIKLGDAFDYVRLDRDALGEGRHILEAGAAMSITRLLRVTKREKLAGVECLGGVPATVGGAVRMNAGTRLGELSDCLVDAQILRPHVAAQWVPAADLGLSYRRSNLPPRAIVTAARFACSDADPKMRERLEEVLAYRKSTQPLHLPSCGSVFANPEGDSAGRLIDVAGLKGEQVGGAQISEQHANWIVNTGDATASDVLALIHRAIETVQRESGVRLRPEVQLVGDWPADVVAATYPPGHGHTEAGHV